MNSHPTPLHNGILPTALGHTLGGMVAIFLLIQMAQLDFHTSRTFSDIIFHGIFGTAHPQEDYRGKLSLPGTVYESSSDALCRGNTLFERPASETAVDSSSVATTESSPPFQVVVKNLVTD